MAYLDFPYTFKKKFFKLKCYLMLVKGIDILLTAFYLFMGIVVVIISEFCTLASCHSIDGTKN